jgi:hypothetical protein
MKIPLLMSGNVIRKTVLLLALVSAQTLAAQVQIPPAAPSTANTNKIPLSPVPSIVLLEALTNQVAAGSSNSVSVVRWTCPGDRQDTVTITGWVKIQGVYQYRDGITVANLVAAAGGLRDKVIPGAGGPIHFRPDSIDVYRPGPPYYGGVNVFKCVYQFKLRDETNAGESEATFELQAGDDVSISMSPCVP